MQTLTISKENKRTKKSREFSALMLSLVAADTLWPGGGGGSETELRPVYLSVVGSEPALRPFLANLLAGERIALSGKIDLQYYWLRFLKTTAYDVIWQREEAGCIATVYLPEVFKVSAGLVDPDTCAFLSLPPRWWVERQRKIIAGRGLDRPVIAHARRLGLFEDVGEYRERNKNALSIPMTFTPELVREVLPLAVHFTHCLDMRSTRPLIPDLAFCLQVYLSALVLGIAQRSAPYGAWHWAHHDRARSSTFLEVDTDKAGFCPGAVMSVSHERLDGFLSQQVQLYEHYQRSSWRE